jgi:hypothetical protein
MITIGPASAAGAAIPTRKIAAPAPINALSARPLNRRRALAGAGSAVGAASAAPRPSPRLCASPAPAPFDPHLAALLSTALMPLSLRLFF